MEWIKCSDKLPEKSGRYLIFEVKEEHSHNCAAYNYPIACCEPNIAYFRCFQANDWEFYTHAGSICKPDYWMTLPEKPNEGDELLQKILDKEWELKIDNKWPLPENPNE